MPPEDDSFPLATSEAPTDQYTPDAVRRCHSALATLVKAIGTWGPTVTVIGGLVPQFLIPEPPADIEPHRGTNDIDLVVPVYVPTEEDPDFYTSIEDALDGSHFQPAKREDGRGLSTWRWERLVDDTTIQIEFLCETDGAGRIGRLGATESNKLGDRLGAHRMRGAALAARDFVEVALEADLLDNGGKSRVNVRVANLLPLLAMKAFAIEGRIKDKDLYDIVWTLNAWPPDGPVSAAQHARTSVVAQEKDAREGIEVLQRVFADERQEGPMRYARFFLGPAGDDDRRARLALDSLGTVRRFLKGWTEELKD